VATGYQSSTPSWQALRRLRKQGQKPIAFVAVTDSGRRQAYWERLGFWSLPLPAMEDCYLVSGLWVLLDVERNQGTAERALAIASSHPRRLQIHWRGEKFETVIA
jgi:hypothetical protein